MRLATWQEQYVREMEHRAQIDRASRPPLLALLSGIDLLVAALVYGFLV